jgi:hypothetical protein
MTLGQFLSTAGAYTSLPSGFQLPAPLSPLRESYLYFAGELSDTLMAHISPADKLHVKVGRRRHVPLACRGCVTVWLSMCMRAGDVQSGAERTDGVAGRG